jgi:ABC-type dipeptide/oligopeptide/nickel transport system permease component
MATYLIKRLLQGIVVLLAVSFVCFIMFRYTGDPVLMLAGKYATQQEREMVRVSYGWTAPFTFSTPVSSVAPSRVTSANPTSVRWMPWT